MPLFLGDKAVSGISLGVPGKSAYDAAKENGFVGTEEEFGQQMANLGSAATEEYVDQKISEIPTPDVSGQIGEHNQDPEAHSDIREAITSHVLDAENPHGVTAAQVGAPTVAEMNATCDDIRDVISKVSSDVRLIFGSGEPTESTAGAIGQMYYDNDGEAFYVCLSHAVNGENIVYMWVELGGSSGNEGVFGTRGPIIFTESGEFDPTAYGLKKGDKVNVLAIGAGGGGAGGAGVTSMAGAGGDGGKCGTTGPYNTASPGGGGGGQYGPGGGGGAGGSNGDSPGAGGGGGGSGYLVRETCVLNDANIVPITIGQNGIGGSIGGDGGDGGDTMFGTYVIAEGGKGGKAGSSGSSGVAGGAAGTGQYNGGAGGGTPPKSGNNIIYGGGGGGGAGGWYVTTFTDITAPTNGANGAKGTADETGGGSGAGGTGGGTGGGAAAKDGTGFISAGVVMIWY